MSTAKTLRRFGGNSGHTGRVNAVSFCGEGEACLVSAGFDKSVRVWDLKSGGGGGAGSGGGGRPVMVMEEAGDSVSALWVPGGGGGGSAGGGYEIWSGSVDGRVRVYDVRMGRLVTDVLGASVTSLMGTRDGKGMLVGALDDTVRLMDRDGGGLLRAYKAEGWKNDEFRMRSAFGGNEKWVLCGNEDVKGDDGEVVVWDTLTGKVVERVRVGGSKVGGKKKIGSDGKEKEKRNVVSCVTWKENGRGDQWCCAGTDGIVTVFGPPP